MKLKFIMSILIFLIALTGMSAISGHGVDVTDDAMVIVNESNAIETKKLVDSMNLDIKVYKFTAEGDVEHILEHSLENPNKKILAVAFQDTVTNYVNKHSNLEGRVFTAEDNEADIKAGLLKLNEMKDKTSGESMTTDYTTFVLVIVIIGLVAGIGVFLLKKK